MNRMVIEKMQEEIDEYRKALESILVLCVEGVEVMDCVKIVWAVEKIAAEALKRGNDD